MFSRTAGRAGNPLRTAFPLNFSDRGLYPEFCPAPCGAWRTIYLLRPTLRPARRRWTGYPWRNFGLASGGACHAPPVARRAVRSYRTFSPLPFRAVYSLWRCPSAGDIAPASRPMAPPFPFRKKRRDFEPAPCPAKFGSSSPPLREERPSVRGLKFMRSRPGRKWSVPGTSAACSPRILRAHRVSLDRGLSAG